MRTFAAVLVFLVHVAAVVLSLSGPALVLVGTFFDDGRTSLVAWRHVFGDLERWRVLLTDTGVVAGTAVAIDLALGTVLAVVLFKTDLRGRRPALAIVVLLAAMPLYVVSAAAFSLVGIEPWRKSALMVGVVHAAAYLPLVVLIVGIALRGVSADLEEAARVDGAGAGRVLTRVTLPLAAGGLAASAVLVVLWTVTDYSVSDVLMVRTFAEETYTQFLLHGRPEEPALTSLPLIAVFGVLFLALARSGLADAWSAAGEQGMAWIRWGLLRPVVTLLVPALLLAWYLTPVWTLADRVESVADLRQAAISFVPEVQTSAWMSVTAGLGAGLLAVGLAWFLVRSIFWRWLLLAYVVIMLALPAPVLGISLIQLLNRPGWPGEVYDAPAMIALAYLVRFLPVAVVVMVPAVRAIPREYEWAAMLDGASRLDIWGRIIWPLCLPSAGVATFLVIALSIGELPCSLLAAPPGYVTVGARFFSLIHYGLYPDAATLCLIALAMVLLPGMTLYWLLRRRLVPRPQP